MKKHALDFEGKTILITGSTRGIGFAYAQYFAALGANLIINGMNEKNLEEALEKLQSSDGKICGIACPVEQGENIVQYALNEFRDIDVVINNAGIIQDARFQNLSLEAWDTIYKNHLEAAFRISRAIWPHFASKGGGNILFTASSAGIFGHFGQSNYSAAKAGIIGLAKTLAIEGKPLNIKVNTICPGAYTDMTSSLMAESLQQQLHPDKVSPVAAWLCHDECPDSGEVVETAAGWIAKVRHEYSEVGIYGNFSIETIKEIWPEVSAFKNKLTYPHKVSDSSKSIIEHANKSLEKPTN